MDLFDLLFGSRVGYLLGKSGVEAFYLAFLVKQFAELFGQHRTFDVGELTS